MAGHPQGVSPRPALSCALHIRSARCNSPLRDLTQTTEGVIRGPRHNPAHSRLVVWWAVVHHQRRSLRHHSAPLRVTRCLATPCHANHRGPSNGAAHPNTQPFGCLVG